MGEIMVNKKVPANSDVLAKNLKKLRINKGISQDELAISSGVSRTTLSTLERGFASCVSFDNIKSLAKALDAEPDDLLFAKTV